MKKVIIIFAIWLIFVNVFALIANNRIYLTGDSAYTWQTPETYTQKQTWDPISLHTQWDSAFYLFIAEHGYNYNGEGLSNIAFFPLYPMLMRISAPVLFGNYALAGWLISIFSLFFALYYIKKLVDEFHPGVSPTLVIAFLLIFPTAFFLNVVYTEALFLFLSVASLYYARKQSFALAGLIGVLAAFTRSPGFLLMIPLAIEYLRSEKKPLHAFPALFLPLFAPLIYFSFHALWYGDFFAFFKVEDAWGRALEVNSSHFAIISSAGGINLAMDIFFLLIGIAAAIFVIWKVRLSYGIYMLAMLTLALATGTLLSIGRFVLVLFPIFIAVAMIHNAYIKLGIAFASILLLALYTLLFVNGYWAG
ncbi:MAG: mannosyltransferase family protein [Patescibacteria group bacterium]|jgi:Gpi18-like mannosyltransferase